jgi:hypothetical protein
MSALILNFFYLCFFTIFIFQIGSYFAFKLKNKITDEYKSLKFFFGIFLLGNIIVFLNFFLPTSSYLTYLFFFMLFALSFRCRICYKYIFKIVLINLIVYPVCLKMTFEYDAGLYHLPYQNILRNEKIIFGIANISRFGFSSFQEYLGSVIWYPNFIFHKFLIGSFLTFFILFLDDLRKTKLNLDNIYFYLTLLSLPFLSRYLAIYTTLTDFSSGVVIILQFYFSIKIFLLSKRKKIDLDNVQVLTILTFLSIALKPSGALTLILFFLIIIFSIKSYDLLKLFFLRNILLIVLAFGWILKNVIISGCVIYPISFSCYSFFDWNASIQAEQDSLAIISWNRQPFVGLEETIFSNNWFFNYWIKTYDKFLLSTLFLLFFIFIVNFIFFYFRNKKAHSFFYVFFPFIIIFTFQTEAFFLLQKLFNFYLFLTLATIGLILCILIFYNYYKIILENISKNYQFLIVFNFYLFLTILVWFYKAPNPRFGFGYFFCLFIYFGVLLHILFNGNLNIFNFSNNYKFKKFFIMYSFIIIIFSQTGPTSTHYSIYNYFNNSFFTQKLNTNYFDINNIPIVEVEKRKNFGFRPLNSDQCWLNLYCYSSADDVMESFMAFNYKKIKSK